MSHIKAMQEKGEKDPNSEFYYYPFFQKWLWNRIKDTGRDHKLLTTLQFTTDCSREFDVVGGFRDAGNKIRLYSVEVKIDNSFDTLLQQAKIRQQYCHHCWIAHSLKNSANFMYHVIMKGEYLLERGIGVLLIDIKNQRVTQCLETRISKNKYVKPLFKNKLIAKLGLNQLEFLGIVETKQIILERDKK